MYTMSVVVLQQMIEVTKEIEWDSECVSMMGKHDENITIIFIVKIFIFMFCYFKNNGDFLFLSRLEGKSIANKWKTR